MPKKTVVEIGYGFFDQPEMQLLNDYKISFSFWDYNFQNSGACNILLER